MINKIKRVNKYWQMLSTGSTRTSPFDILQKCGQLKKKNVIAPTKRISIKEFLVNQTET
jgi:3-deoxy-D-arabino-heptulosonate 7-phosphate (DAHP) synthase